jgi:hypothetical protein
MVCQPALGLPLAQKVVVLSGAQGWSFPGSSADIFFSRNGGSCTIKQLPVACSSLLSITRASTKYVTWTDGHLSQVASGVIAVSDNGAEIEQSSTNQALCARDMTTATCATAWVAVNITPAKTATGADNVANSASLLTAGAANGTILQTFTIGSTTETYSVLLERVTGTGNIQITENNGSTWTTADSSICKNGAGVASNLLTTAYVRCSVEATLANPVIGIRIVTNGDAVNADFNQDEELAFATSPIATTSATVTRAADVITASGALLTAILAAKAMRFVTNNVVGTIGPRLISDSAGNNGIQYNSSTQAEITNGVATNSATFGSGTRSGLVKVAVGLAASGTTIIVNSGTKATDATAWAGLGSSAYLGNYSGGDRALNGYFLRLTVGPTKGQFDAMTTGSNPQ